MQDKGYDHILVVETQPADYVKQKQKYMGLIRRVYAGYPRFIKAIEDRYIMYNKEKAYVRQQEKNDNILVIRPEAPLNISPLTRDRAELLRVYELGRQQAKAMLQRSTWLNS